MGVCHRKSSPRGGGLVTLTVTNPHLAPPMPAWGVVGHNIDRCIIIVFSSSSVVFLLQSRVYLWLPLLVTGRAFASELSTSPGQKLELNCPNSAKLEPL